MGDANFRLKNRANKNGHRDITLGPGLAYAIAPDLLTSHLKNYEYQDEVSRIELQRLMLPPDDFV